MQLKRKAGIRQDKNLKRRMKSMLCVQLFFSSLDPTVEGKYKKAWLLPTSNVEYNKRISSAHSRAGFDGDSSTCVIILICWERFLWIPIKKKISKYNLFSSKGLQSSKIVHSAGDITIIWEVREEKGKPSHFPPLYQKHPSLINNEFFLYIHIFIASLYFTRFFSLMAENILSME